MNTLDNLIRLRWVRATLAAFGLAAALFAVSPQGAEAQRAAASEQAQPDGVVNIQTASPEQLQLLPGIGPSKAEAIVSHRERRAFRRVEDLMRVRGIGRATFRRLRSMLTVDGPTTMAAPQRSGGAASE
ncbi:MAG: helix-hairpin-helix domain-containing protein [Myxococcota bacterium]|nr:helix-hairpin-helix domain-containing protein [Myxococcota bacterium]